MTSLFQLTSKILLALCCVRTATVFAGLLPEAGSNGYQYNRPITTTGGGAFAGLGGIVDPSNRRSGYTRDSSSGRLPLGLNPLTSPGFGGSGSGSGSVSGSGSGSVVGGGSVNAFDFGGRTTNTYSAPGFANDFARGIGYNPRPTNTYNLPNGYNSIGNYQGDGSIAPGYNGINDPYRNRYDLDDNRPRPYSFQYQVFDPPSGNDYGQQESSDGNVVQGEYRVLLPDSRTQIVKYTADNVNGYNADVQYEGQAQYPNTITANSPTSVGYQFPGSASEGPYQPTGFPGLIPYQGKRGGVGGISGVGGYSRPNGDRFTGANNNIFGNSGGVAVSTGPGNQYLPPTGGYGK
uniref:Cuticular protein 17 n=1 Tax=Microplitis mediator TaxID=375433 RepID=A0A650DLL4_9HYME|nr:cuticular protein 17 [Microplitis mediator]